MKEKKSMSQFALKTKQINLILPYIISGIK